MMSPEKIKEFIDRDELGTNERIVALVLILHADSKGQCWPSVKTLMQWTRLSRASIMRALAKLEKANLIRRGKTARNRNIYYLSISSEQDVSERDMSHRETTDVSERDMSHRETTDVSERDMSHRETTDVSERDIRCLTERHQRSQSETSPPSYSPLSNKDTNELTNELTNEEREYKREYSAHAKSSLVEIPSLDEVKGYAVAIGLPAQEAEAFHDYYSARGWELRNGQQMRDWRAALRNWKRHWMEREQTVGKAKARQPRKPNPLWGLTEPGSEEDQEWRF